MPAPVSRRNFVKTASLAVLGSTIPGIPAVFASPGFDLIIKDGTILDGTGGPAWKADLGIQGDTIAAIGEIDPEQGKQVIQASGLHVCPGFIDIHTHSDGMILVYPYADSRVLQGVTTELTGNCGGSAAPLVGINADKRRQEMREDDDIPADWTDVASYFARVEQTGISVNHAMLVGQGTLRQNAVGAVDRPLSADELKAVKKPCQV